MRRQLLQRVRHLISHHYHQYSKVSVHTSSTHMSHHHTHMSHHHTPYITIITSTQRSAPFLLSSKFFVLGSKKLHHHHHQHSKVSALAFLHVKMFYYEFFFTIKKITSTQRSAPWHFYYRASLHRGKALLRMCPLPCIAIACAGP